MSFHSMHTGDLWHLCTKLSTSGDLYPSSICFQQSEVGSKAGNPDNRLASKCSTTKCEVHCPLDTYLCNQLNDTAGLLDLALSLLAEPSGSYNDRDFWDAALAEDLGVAERKEVEDGSGVGLLARDVFVTGLFGNQ